MSPRFLLLIVSIGLILINLVTVEYRKRNSVRFERQLGNIFRGGEREMSLQDISEELQIPLYDAKVLARKLVSEGKMEVHAEGEHHEVYIFKSLS